MYLVSPDYASWGLFIYLFLFIIDQFFVYCNTNIFCSLIQNPVHIFNFVWDISLMITFYCSPHCTVGEFRFYFLFGDIWSTQYRYKPDPTHKKKMFTLRFLLLLTLIKCVFLCLLRSEGNLYSWDVVNWADNRHWHICKNLLDRWLSRQTSSFGSDSSDEPSLEWSGHDHTVCMPMSV